MVLSFVVLSFFFFFKQKTAYEMRISDWSSDVCSSDLADRNVGLRLTQQPVADHAARDLAALAARHRRIIDREAHRQRRRIDRLRGDRLAHARVDRKSAV